MVATNGSPPVIQLTSWCFRSDEAPHSAYIEPGQYWVHAVDQVGQMRIVAVKSLVLVNGRLFEAKDGITYELVGPPRLRYVQHFAWPRRIWFLEAAPFQWNRLAWHKWQIARLCAWVVHLGMGMHWQVAPD